jgi:hypothetical protein
MKKVLYACGALVALIATGPLLAADLAEWWLSSRRAEVARSLRCRWR